METIKNILQLMRFYWRTEKKLYLRLFFMFWAIFLVKISTVDFIFMRINSDVYNFSHTAINAYIYYGCILITISYLFNAIHHKQRAIDYISLPASNIEKFFSRYLLGVVGIPLLTNASVLAAAGAVTLLLGTIDCFVGNQPEWARIFYYYCGPFGFPTLRETLGGIRPVSSYLSYLFWSSMFMLSFNSLFIWFGTAFRRAGWVYALIAIFVFIAFLIFVLDVTGIGRLHSPHTVGHIVRLGSVLLTVLYTYLAYRSFCHAQIVSHKSITL
ncbi:MAG: hypothetical protein J5924_05240 [Bacteroidaceae bacterium]|nr:hypothetical protein [Bacteroidaceae bacterium]